MKTKAEFRVQPSYNESFKRKVVRDLLTGKYTKKESMDINRISMKAISNWLNKYGQNVILEENIETITLKKYNMSRKNKITESEKILELRKQIKQLEKQLQESQLQAKINEKIIDIAEEQFQIPIRKKFVTRQSPKSKDTE